MKISLCGAAGEVTGSGYLVETASARVLVDFGMFQGVGATRSRNADLGPVDPSRLDAVVLTHAHLDHTGRLPLLVRGGFGGRIHGTAATGDFARLILEDSARIQQADAKRHSRRLRRKGREPVEPLYTTEDVQALEPLAAAVRYGERVEVAEGVSVTTHEAGHILGSASIAMEIADGAATRRVVFSGDLGPRGVPFLRDPDPPEGADLVFLESTYGGREHRALDATVDELHELLERAVARTSRVLIPAFAIGRTQQLLYHIAELVHEQGLPAFPIYLDSPMATRATKLYRKHQDLFDEEARELASAHRLPRDLPGLRFIESVEESMRLNDDWAMCVIIAGSGMCDGGRMVHHLKHSLWRHNAEVVIVGYQAEGTLGRRLVRREPSVRIHGEKILVRAQVHTLGGFSAHAGQRELVEWAAHVVEPGGAATRIVLTHGEDEARVALAGALKTRVGIEAERPGRGAVVTL